MHACNLYHRTRGRGARNQISVCEDAPMPGHIGIATPSWYTPPNPRFLYVQLVLFPLVAACFRASAFSFSPNRNCWGSQFILQRVDGQDVPRLTPSHFRVNMI